MMVLTVSSADQIDWTAAGTDQIRNNILNILRTRRGEVPYMSGLGLTVDYVDTPALQGQSAMEQDIRTQLAKWEPSASLDSLSITADKDGNYIAEVVISL